ncbi:MAG: hypothetical protein PWQ18_263, partial [Clostridia bacterium]|nr:hypothetical protein [Clostridia bacterium]
PLYQSLWSTHDERVGHLLRYRPGRVDSLLNRASFNVLYRTSWNLPGLPGAFLRKMGLDINSAVDRFGPLMKLEARLAARFPLPLGLSGFWVGGKP